MTSPRAASGRSTASARHGGNADAERPFASFPRVTIASYPDYGEAETAVDRLSDQGFPVERVAIVSTGLRAVEQVEGRMTAWRAALIGAVVGMLFGGLLALVAGMISSELNSTEAFLYSLGVCTLFGAVSGALVHVAASAGRRDFVSVRRMEADRHEIQVDEAVAGEAKRILAAVPADESETSA
jgi:hypothetical protein